MTLLESIVALVIVGLFAVGCLELFEGATVGARNSAEWTTAVAYAEEGMESAKAGARSDLAPEMATAAGFNRTIAQTPARPGLAEFVVTVSLPRGGSFVLRRLIESP